MKRAFSVIGLALLGLALGLLVIEGALRLFPALLPYSLRPGLEVDVAAIEDAHHTRATLMAEDGYLGRVLRPDVTLHVEGHPDYAYDIQTISLGFGEGGFRDDGIGAQVYAVAVGDSFTFGDGVALDNTWVYRLEEAVGGDVVNTGVPGYSSIQNMRNLAAYGLQLEPEVVLWAFSGNDPSDDYDFQLWLSSDEPSFGGWQRTQLARDPDADPDLPAVDEGGPRNALAERSRIYGVVNLALETVEEPFQPYVDSSLDFRFKFDTVWDKYLNPDQDRLHYGLELAQFNVLEGQRLAAERGAAFVLVLVPFKEQVYWPIVSRFVDRADDYDVDWMTEAMLEFCEANDLVCVDLLPDFRERAADGEQLYFRTDGHWNEAGHALAADLIFTALDEQDLLPEE